MGEQTAETMAPGDAGTALVVLPPAQFPTIIAADSNDILGKLAKELAGFRGDLTTERGRKEIASKAFKVATAKMDLVRLSDRLKEDAQKTIKGVNAERNLIIERMDALRDKVRKPLDDFEAREAERVKGHEAAIEDLRLLGIVPEGFSSQGARDALNKLIDLHADRQWQEFEDKAEWVRHTSRTALLSAMHAAEEREKAELDAALLAIEEAARAQAEIERLQVEREAEIARQAGEVARVAAETAAREEAARVAAEAEAARVAAEQTAQAERERIESEAREAAEAAKREIARVEAERVAAEERATALAAKQEADRVDAHGRALDVLAALGADTDSTPLPSIVDAKLTRLAEIYGRDWQEFYDGATEIHDEVYIRLTTQLQRSVKAEAAEFERQRALAAQKAEALRLAAVEEERKRVEAENAEIARQAKLREDDKAWRGKINREVVAALLVCGLSEEHAKAVVVALAKDQIPHVSIVY